jgi:hypothetical protein
MKSYPYPAVKPVVVGRTKLVPVGGFTRPTDTKSDAAGLKLAMMKSPGSCPEVFLMKKVGDGAVIEGVAATAEAIGKDAIVVTLVMKTKNAIKAIFDIREVVTAKPEA